MGQKDDRRDCTETEHTNVTERQPRPSRPRPGLVEFEVRSGPNGVKTKLTLGPEDIYSYLRSKIDSVHE